jgi:uncharacterized protein YhaN
MKHLEKNKKKKELRNRIHNLRKKRKGYQDEVLIKCFDEAIWGIMDELFGINQDIRPSRI